MAMVESAAAGTKPALLVDIDGVFIINRKLEGNTPGYIEHPRYRWSAYNPAHGSWLNSIHEKLAEIYYISDHQDNSHEVIGRHLEIPEFDWINNYAFNARSEGACRALAITALFGKRPLAWVDDCIRPTQLKWAKQRTQAGAPTLAVRVNPDIGLQPGQMQTVNDWLQQLVTPTS